MNSPARIRRRRPVFALTLAAATAAGAVLLPQVLPSAAAQSKEPPKLDEAAILKGVKGPKGYDVTVFAMPPEVMYPTAVAAAPGGEVYVAIDEQGSLGKDPRRGRVVKAVDTDGDGKADRFTTFAKMDHPRGVHFDPTTDTLYVLHPPTLSAYRDTDGDGVSDSSEVLVSGIANATIQKQRGADHTTNGFRVGIDGWIYVAMGDFGATKAVGKDGTTLQVHGGCVARVRLDGSGLEAYSAGQRNIYDVAVSPLLDCFTRDNTNDGGGWDVRLSHVAPTANFGYPRLFKNFGDEVVQPLAVYGGGSPCGALFLDEPGARNGLYTVEWGRSQILYHPLEASGATFKPMQEEFMTVPRATDMDVDAAGNLYVSSWINGGFSYSGPNVGYVVKATPKEKKAEAFPADVRKVSDERLLAMLGSASAVTRQAAQREILRRGKADGAKFAPALEKLAGSREPLAVRVAAIFTLKQLAGNKSHDVLANLTKDAEVREFALRALADVKGDASAPVGPFVEALTDANPRVRLAAAWGLERLGNAEPAARLLPLVADADPVVSHVAINALVALRAAGPALRAVDASSDPKLTAGALRVLQGLHDTQVVDALAEKLKAAQEPGLRGQILKTLCRLHWREADWSGDWWGTRPDTSGPYYKTAAWEGTAKVGEVLRAALTSEKPEVVRQLVVHMQRNKVEGPEMVRTLQDLAKQDPSFKAVLVELAANKRDLSEENVALLRDVAADANEPAAVRAQALRVFQKHVNKNNAIDAAVTALAATAPAVGAGAPKPDKELADAFNEFLRDAKPTQQVATLTKIAETDAAPAKREVAYAILLNMANSKLVERDKNVANVPKTIEAAWAKPDRTAPLLRAIARTKSESYADRVRAAAADPNPQVASAAKAAAEQLKLSTSASPGGAAARIEKLSYDDVVAAAQKSKGDAKVGAELYAKVGCAQCHTVSPTEAPKGPFLGGISVRYNRAELCESILKPSAKIMQGFETQWFKTTDDEDLEGFVTREAGDELDLRDITGAVTTIKKADVKERGKREKSAMPEGLVAKLTPAELASLLAYLESLKGQ
jgi:putative membrane-bound dehydrogenase-like protein